MNTLLLSAVPRSKSMGYDKKAAFLPREIRIDRKTTVELPSKGNYGDPPDIKDHSLEKNREKSSWGPADKDVTWYTTAPLPPDDRSFVRSNWKREMAVIASCVGNGSQTVPSSLETSSDEDSNDTDDDLDMGPLNLGAISPEELLEPIFEVDGELDDWGKAGIAIHTNVPTRDPTLFDKKAVVPVKSVQTVDLDCGICFEYAVQPKMTRCCGALFCSEHIYDWLNGPESDGLCPSCEMLCLVNLPLPSQKPVSAMCEPNDSKCSRLAQPHSVRFVPTLVHLVPQPQQAPSSPTPDAKDHAMNGDEEIIVATEPLFSSSSSLIMLGHDISHISSVIGLVVTLALIYC